MSGGMIKTDTSGLADIVMDTKGDMVDFDTSRQKLSIGSVADVLTVSAGGLPSWVAPSAGGSASTEIVQFQANFSTTSTSPVDITNYSLTLPTVAGSDNCFLMFDVTMARGAVSDAYQFDLIKNTTRVASNTCEPTDNGYNENLSMNTVVDADGDTLKAQMSSAGGNSGTFKSNTTTINSAMTAYAV